MAKRSTITRSGIPALATVSALAIGGVLPGATPAAAQQAPPVPSCTGPEFSRMDFWLGRWEVSWTGQDGVRQTGRNTITRILDGCVVEERFEGGPGTGNLVGISHSTWHAGANAWRQTWVDNQGGYFALVGGPRPDGTFELVNTRLAEGMPHLRMLFQDITADSLTWRWQHSPDGKEWTDRWRLDYRRLPD